MTLRCPECGEKALELVEFEKRSAFNRRDKAIYVCSSCKHREVIS
jgi:DNA-directed RNA polymerase subunit RPC12/RpoP|tara:strand:+ start:1081 stop:1215 length:135 start_codon:yes stop_codon:yes gene_type:complete